MIGLLASLTISADTIVFDYQLLGSYHSGGLYNLVGNDFYNGAPLTAYNMPSEYERELSANINFYASRSDPHDLFVQVIDVVGSHFFYTYGTPTNMVLMTGLEFWLPFYQPPQTAEFSNNHANPAQALLTDSGSVPLMNTPGWVSAIVGPRMYSIHTQNGVTDALSSFTWVTGETVITGGAVFELSFSPSTNLFTDVDYQAVILQTIWGNGNQTFAGSYNGPDVPEPSEGLMITAGLVAFMFGVYRKRCPAAAVRRVAVLLRNFVRAHGRLATGRGRARS
jgi:hypothetical protein